MARGSESRQPDDELTALVTKHVEELVSALREQLREQVAKDIQRYFAVGSSAMAAGPRATGTATGTAKANARKILPCIALGCKNPSKGPRFRYLCEKHRGASKREYAVWHAAQKAARKASKRA